MPLMPEWGLWLREWSLRDGSLANYEAGVSSTASLGAARIIPHGWTYSSIIAGIYTI
jgi:hypothetical protein